MNAIIQSKLQSKSLELGHKKCFQMYIGKPCISCQTLTVHQKEMLTTNHEKYLGEIISSNGKLENKIAERFNKGLGIVNEIIGTLKEISFGVYYFNMALMFRTTILVNGMLNSSEALYGIKNTHIEQLESIDTMLFKSVFQSPFSTPIAAYYLETGAIPLRFILKGRRLMYLWNILQKNEDELVTKVYNAQKLFPVKDDFFFQIKEDMDDLGLDLEEEAIKNMKKVKFKNLVNGKIRDAAQSYLIQKKENLSKLKNISCRFELKEYLTTNRLSTSENSCFLNYVLA